MARGYVTLCLSRRTEKTCNDDRHHLRGEVVGRGAGQAGPVGRRDDHEVARGYDVDELAAVPPREVCSWTRVRDPPEGSVRDAGLRAQRLTP